MPFPNEHAARVADPSRFDEFRRVNDQFATGIHAVFGIIVSGDGRTSELQSIRFDKDKFTVTEAKDWLGEHPEFEVILFEAAEEPEAQTIHEMAAAGGPITVPGGACQFRNGAAVQLKDHTPEDQEKKKRRRFSITALSGAIIAHHWWWGNLFIRAEGVRHDGRMPALREHDPDRIVGFIDDAGVDGNQFKAGGIFSGHSDDADKIVAMSDEGFPWQASVFAVPESIQLVDEGETLDLGNGIELTGPGTVFETSHVREISFCALGADAQTSAAALSGAERFSVKVNGGPKTMDGKTCPATRLGENLSSALEASIESMVDDETTRADVIERMGSAAGIDAGTVNQILSGDINCPPLNRLEGFAEALGVSAASLVSAAEDDGCSYGDGDEDDSADTQADDQDAGDGEPVAASAGAEGDQDASDGDDGDQDAGNGDGQDVDDVPDGAEASTAIVADRERAAAITDASVRLGVPDKAAGFIKSGASVEAAAKGLAKSRLELLQGQAPPAAGPGDAPEAPAADGPERWKQEFAGNAAIRQEFKTEGAYLAYKRADGAGYARRVAKVGD